MNERIKELAEQAGFGSAWFEEAPEGHPSLPKEGILKKFAELIVEECVGVLNRRFMGDLSREDMEVCRCIDDVKKHFGVEE